MLPSDRISPKMAHNGLNLVEIAPHENFGTAISNKPSVDFLLPEKVIACYKWLDPNMLGSFNAMESGAMLIMLGIPNCDSVKRAQRFLNERGVQFAFRDLRKQPLSPDEWRSLLAQDHENRLLNTRSPSFRKLGLDPLSLNEATKVTALVAQPTAMKRPVMLGGERLLTVGFNESEFRNLVTET